MIYLLVCHIVLRKGLSRIKHAALQKLDCLRAGAQRAATDTRSIPIGQCHMYTMAASIKSKHTTCTDCKERALPYCPGVSSYGTARVPPYDKWLERFLRIIDRLRLHDSLTTTIDAAITRHCHSPGTHLDGRQPEGVLAGRFGSAQGMERRRF